jgi:hypothetical protein
MRLKRQLLRPGRRIEQIGQRAAHPFFAWQASARTAPPRADGAARRRGLLPSPAENAGAPFSIAISLVLLAALIALAYAFVRDIRRDAVELDTFTAPKQIAERGYTSTAIAEAVKVEARLRRPLAFD